MSERDPVDGGHVQHGDRSHAVCSSTTESGGEGAKNCKSISAGCKSYKEEGTTDEIHTYSVFTFLNGLRGGMVYWPETQETKHPSGESLLHQSGCEHVQVHVCNQACRQSPDGVNNSGDKKEEPKSWGFAWGRR